MPEPESTDPRPWWHHDLAREVERRDRDLEGRIRILEESTPERRLADLEREAHQLRRALYLAIAAIPALTEVLSRIVSAGTG